MIRPAEPSPADLREKYRTLVQSVRDLEGAVIAFSGGVDSAFLLKAGVDALGHRIRAVLGRSPSVPEEVLERARRVALDLGVRLEEIETGEMERPEYLRNGPDRCFYCKETLYGLMSRLRRWAGNEVLLDGTNRDDLSDVRPGLEAARLHGVRSLLAEQDWSKEEIREMSRSLGLATWDQPASPCLSSRIPHGTPVTREALRRIDKAERNLRGLGMREVRVRHHGDLARIEVPAGDLQDLFALRKEVVEALEDAGYHLVTVDLRGYRRGGADSAPEGRRADGTAEA